MLVYSVVGTLQNVLPVGVLDLHMDCFDYHEHTMWGNNLHRFIFAITYIEPRLITISFGIYDSKNREPALKFA